MRTYCLSDFRRDDVEEMFRACFAAAQQDHAPVKVVIPPGAYHLAPTVPIPLFSGLTVEAFGAEFRWPEKLADPVHREMFKGVDVCDLRWTGGKFVGHVFDVPPAVPAWAPGSCTRCIVIETTSGGKTRDLSFREIRGVDCSGSVVSVYGFLGSGDRPMTRAENIEVRNCRFERCGKFMWDYGWLWEKVVFPAHFTAAEIALGERYASPENRSGEVRFHGDHITVDRMPVLRHEERHPFDTIAFYGKELPPEIQRGRCYFIVHEENGKFFFSDVPGGAPIRTTPGAGGDPRLFRNLFTVFHWGYAPQDQGPGKGSLDVVGCRGLQVTDCELSANGDAMHIHSTSDVLFRGNRITGARMGAFFLAFDCDHAVVSDNIVDGTNGSRVLTVERGCHDVIIRGNIFSGGGRGCWFNENHGIVLADNIFRNNVLKGVPRYGAGRRSPFSGAFEAYPEIYFTDARKSYDNIIMRGNSVEATEGNTQPSILFQQHGSGIILEDNILIGGTRQISIAEGVEVQKSGNQGVAEYNRREIPEAL